MALIALKWDSRFIRIAVATSSRGRVQFDRALAVELAGETEELSPARLGDKLRAILEKVGVSKGEATVIITRGDVEMRQFSLPPVPPEELPDMVRFQARNHFTSFNDEFLLDFIPVSRTAEANTVLAAAISGEQARKIRDTIEAAGLKLRHIVVRPFAAAELVRSGCPGDRCRVLLELIGREADISIVDNDYVLMTRTVRVPETYTDEQFDAWLPGEIRRTIAAAGSQAGAREVEEIVVCGTASRHDRLCQDLREAFQLETRFFQPLDSIHKSGRFEPPAHQDGFASLLGSLVQSTSEDTHALDFLNPRKKPEKTGNRRRLAVFGGLAASLLVMGLIFIWMMFQSRDAKIAELQTDIEQMQANTAVTDAVIEQTAPVDEWKKRQFDWLESMHTLSTLFPGPADTRLSQFNASVHPEGAEVVVRGWITENERLDQIDQKLHASPFTVKDKDWGTSQEAGFYRSFSYTLGLPVVELSRRGSRKEVASQTTDAGTSNPETSNPETPNRVAPPRNSLPH